MESQIDRIAIASLEKQYGIHRSVLYERMNALGIKRVKLGNKAYINSKDLQLLDDLDAHMKAGHPMALFLDSVGFGEGRQSEIQTANIPETPILNEIKETRFSIQLLPAEKGKSGWEDYEQLDKVTERQWILPTSRLFTLLGIKSIPKRYSGSNSFACKGYFCTKVGRNRETMWRVTKQIN